MKTKKTIMMLAMVLPIVLFAQNNVSKQKLDRPVIENKPYKYEYVISFSHKKFLKFLIYSGFFFVIINIILAL